MHVCRDGCTHVYVYIRVQWSEDSLGGCSSGTHPLLFVRQALSLAWDLPSSLGWLTGCRDLLPSTSPAWGSKTLAGSEVWTQVFTLARQTVHTLS